MVGPKPSSSSEPRDVRQAILQAATALFAERGFEGASVQEIAEAVGLTKPGVLHHFPSKDEIRQAVLMAIVDHWQKRLPQLLLAASAGEDRFASVFGELHGFFSEDPHRSRLVLREVLDRPDHVRGLLMGPLKPWIEAIGGYVERGQKAGVHHDDVDGYAYVLHALSLAVSAAVMAPMGQKALGGGREGLARWNKELFRIARSSLFRGTAETKAPARGGKSRGHRE
jgi:AcrR family transcriptional regulator